MSEERSPFEEYAVLICNLAKANLLQQLYKQREMMDKQIKELEDDLFTGHKITID
jgi:hypothetical protein